ncbi:hypothetical protein K1719_029283 [Acacia pycnantha]|nr:hypothetical protein K1719_029283 [Acacia pycnantha]
MMQEYSSSYCSSVAEEAKDAKHDSWLHSVRKPISKPCKKSPVAPMPPSPIKVYNVDPINFRDLVQQLTGAPEFKPHHHHHLQSVALVPPPMPVSSFVDASSRDNIATDLQADTMGMGSKYQDISATRWN